MFRHKLVLCMGQSPPHKNERISFRKRGVVQENSEVALRQKRLVITPGPVSRPTGLEDFLNSRPGGLNIVRVVTHFANKSPFMANAAVIRDYTT